MSDPRPAATQTDTERRLQTRRRAKRGLIASYIHELSVRHGGDVTRRRPRPEAQVEPAPGGGQP